MNNFLALVEQMKIEVDKLSSQYQAVQTMEKENKIEQQKVIDLNTAIKHTLEAVETEKKKVEDKEKELAEREKQIIVREKQNLLIDQKMRELEDRTTELILKENKLKKDKEEFNKEKSILEKKAAVYQKLEETDAMSKARLKLKEDEVDKELEKLKRMAI